MPHATQLRDPRPRLPMQRVVRACLCVALASTTACVFEAGGTGEARTRRSSAFGPISTEPSARDMDEAAQTAADHLRELGEQRAAAEAAAAGKPQAGQAPDVDTSSAGAGAHSVGEAGRKAGAAGAVSQPVVPKDDGRVIPAADSGAPPLDESDAGDDADAGAAAMAGAASPPPMAAGSGGGGGEAGASGMSAAGAGGSGRGGRGEMNGRAGASGAGGDRSPAGQSGSDDERDVSGDTDESSDEGGGRGNGS